MGHHDVESFQLEAGHVGELRPHVGPIGVAVDGGDGGERPEIREHFPLPHVPTVQDVVHLPEEVEYLGSHQAVGV